MNILEELKKYNSNLGISTDKIHTLKSKEPIVTGQQVGLCLTPALSLYKALSAVKLAIENNTIAIFWLQTEDHDFEEIRKYNFLDENYEIRVKQLEKRENALPISDLNLIDEIKALGLESIDLENINAKNISAKSISELFAKLMYSIIQSNTLVDNLEKNIIFLDPSKTKVSAQAKEIYKKCISNFSEISAVLRENFNKLDDPQVELRDDYTLFFLNIDSKRQRLKYESNKFHSSKKSFTEQELLELLENSPEKFSASALLRPVIQDFVLRSDTYVGGKAEIKYLEQSDALFNYFKVKPAKRILRGSITVSEEKFDKWLNQIDANIDSALNDNIATNLVSTEIAPETLRKDSLVKIEQLFKNLENAINTIDSTLLKTNIKSKDKAINAINNILSKYEKSITSKNEIWSVRLKRIRNLLEPKGQKQERFLSALYFDKKYGTRYVEEVFDKIELEKEVTIKL